MGEFLSYILASYNVLFTAPIAFVFFFAIFQLLMGGSDFGGDTDVVDVDVDAVVDVDTRIDADVDSDTHAGSGWHGNSFIATLLRILHVGKVPFTIILMALFSTWGISGLIANELLNVNSLPARFGLGPQSALWISIAAALLCSIFGTRYLALGLTKIFPENERAITNYHLIGLRGRVISGRVTATFGTARVAVPDRPDLTVSCRVQDGEEMPLKGDIVILVDYNSERGIFDVTKADSVLGS